jgi:hypothetical protein
MFMMGPFDSDNIGMTHAQWYKHKHVAVIHSENHMKIILLYADFVLKVVFLHIWIEKPLKDLCFPTPLSRKAV